VIQDSNGCSSLHELCLNCVESGLKGSERPAYFHILERFGKNTLNVKAVDRDGRTALHCAATVGNMPGVRFLLGATDHKADVNSLDKHQRTPLHYAACGMLLNLDFRIIRALVDAGSNTQIKDLCGLRASDYVNLILKKPMLSAVEISVLTVGLRLIEAAAPS
jgi:ankyrin repeat protein